jgi:hypothetical protein
MIHAIKTHNVEDCKSVPQKKSKNKENANTLFIITYLKNILFITFSPLSCS